MMLFFRRKNYATHYMRDFIRNVPERAHLNDLDREILNLQNHCYQSDRNLQIGAAVSLISTIAGVGMANFNKNEALVGPIIAAFAIAVTAAIYSTAEFILDSSAIRKSDCRISDAIRDMSHDQTSAIVRILPRMNKHARKSLRHSRAGRALLHLAPPH